MLKHITMKNPFADVILELDTNIIRTNLPFILPAINAIHTLEDIHKTRSFQKLHQCDTMSVYQKIKYACKHNIREFIEKYVTKALERNHVLQWLANTRMHTW
jgi:hypothetical protein